jgi:branched-chain amino acid transport system ATP-binding protein
MSRPLLAVNDVTRQFGNLVAVDDVSYSLDSGELVALIGPNGAGKTTMYNLLTGRLSPTAGEIRFNGRNIESMSPAERTDLGVGRSFQITNVFEGLTVRQNIRAPIIARSSARFDPISNVESHDEVGAETDEILDMVGLTDIESEECATLSYGDKRRVEIGVTLATDPELVLLDEPAAGMNPQQADEMIDLIEYLYDQMDVTFLVTEHDMDIVFALAERILVLDQGRIIADGSPEAIQTDERVRSAYLGGESE